MAISPYVSQRRPVLTRRPDVLPAAQFNVGDALARTAGAARDIRAADQAAADKHAESEFQIAELERKRANDALASKVAISHAEASNRLRVFAEANKGRADYETAYANEVDRELGATRAMIGDNVEVGQHFDEPLARFAAQEKASASIYAMQVRAKAGAEALKITRETYAGQVQDDFSRLASTVELMGAQVDANPNIPDDLKPAAKREQEGYLISRGLAGLSTRGEYDLIEQALKSPALTASLSPEERDQFADVVAAGRRAEAVAAKAQLAEEKRAVSETISAVKLRIDAGDDSLGPAELKGLMKRAEKFGDLSGATNLQIMMTKVAINRQMKGKDASMRQAAIAELEAQDRAGKLDGGEQIALEHMRTLHKARGDDEAAPLIKEYKTGTQGRVSVAAQLQGLPYQTRMERAEAIKPGFSAVVALPPETRDMAIRGAEDIERVKDHFTGRVAQTSFSKVLGAAGRGYAMTGELDAAKAIYAFRAREQGVDKWDEVLFGEAVTQATGGVKKGNVWHGGLQPYAQGSNTRKVILPSGYSVTNFNDVLRTEATFKSAELANGRAITKADVLRYYTPVLVGKDEQWSHYKWSDDQGGLLGTKGSDEDYILRLRNR